jgi:hypothetical protein
MVLHTVSKRIRRTGMRKGEKILVDDMCNGGFGGL